MATTELVQRPPRTPARSWVPGVGAFCLLAALIGVGLFAGREPARFADAGLVFAPAIALIGLLHLRNWRAVRIASWIVFWLLMLAAGALVLATITFSVQSNSAGGLTSQDADRLVLPAVVILVLLGGGAVLAVTSLWLPLGRALGARLDRTDAAHAQATVAVLLLSALMVAPLALLGGRAPLLDLLSRGAPQDFGDPLLAQVYQTVWTLLLVIWAAAFQRASVCRPPSNASGLGRCGPGTRHRSWRSSSFRWRSAQGWMS